MAFEKNIKNYKFCPTLGADQGNSFAYGEEDEMQKNDMQQIDEFLARFPGRCPICSYHRFGVREGLTSGSVSFHEGCPENGGKDVGVTPPKVTIRQKLRKFFGAYDY